MSKRFLFVLTFLLCFSVKNSFAVEVTCLNESFVRGEGQPVTEHLTFPGIAGDAVLRIQNGASDDSYEKVSSSIISINGIAVTTPDLFNQKVDYIEIPVVLNKGDNELAVQLKSKPGGMIRIGISQEVEAEAAAFIGPEGGIVEVRKNDSEIFGTKLEIPATALDETHLISLKGQYNPNGSGEARIELKPSGLIFNTYAKLIVPLNRSSLKVNEKYTAYSYSQLSEYLSEERLKNIEPLITYTRDDYTIVEFDHFSFIYLFKYEYFHTVYHIPPKYLTEGDILYRLSGSLENLSFWPGHVGLYTGRKNNNYIQVDSYEARTFTLNECKYIISGNCPATYEGVMETAFKYVWSDQVEYDDNTHQNYRYMGARRPKSVNSSAREKAVKFVYDNIGKPWQLVGLEGEEFSCVQLPEAAYESADINISWNDLALTPLQQYNNTEQVNKVVIFPNDSFQLGIYGVLDRNQTTEVPLIAAGDYTKDPTLFTIELSNLPENARFYNNVLSWTPSCDDVGISHRIGIKLTYVRDPNLTINKSFIVSVDGDEYCNSNDQCNQSVIVNGREWQKEADGNQYNWSDADNHCSSLDICGKTDWRLPTEDELYGLIGHSDIVIYESFNNIGPGSNDGYLYWTSTYAGSYEGKDLYAVIRLDSDGDYAGPWFEIHTLGVLCVREN